MSAGHGDNHPGERENRRNARGQFPIDIAGPKIVIDKLQNPVLRKYWQNTPRLYANLLPAASFSSQAPLNTLWLVQIRYDMVSCYVVRQTADAANHEFLQLRRTKDDYMGATWQAIYGQSEKGESPVAAIIRELREEAGLVPDELYLLDPVSIFYLAPSDTLWHCIPFCAVVSRERQVILNHEHDAGRWIPAADAEKLFMWQSNREAIKSIQTNILIDSLARPYMRIPLG